MSRGGSEREKGRHRIPSRLQALSCQHRARCGAQIHRPRDHDLSQSWTLSHPGAPRIFFIYTILEGVKLYPRCRFAPLKRTTTLNAFTRAWWPLVYLLRRGWTPFWTLFLWILVLSQSYFIDGETEVWRICSTCPRTPGVEVPEPRWLNSFWRWCGLRDEFVQHWVKDTLHGQSARVSASWILW